MRPANSESAVVVAFIFIVLGGIYGAVENQIYIFGASLMGLGIAIGRIPRKGVVANG